MKPSNPSTEMFDVLDETEADLIGIQVERGTKQDYYELYSLLIERSEAYSSISVYEEVLIGVSGRISGTSTDPSPIFGTGPISTFVSTSLVVIQYRQLALLTLYRFYKFSLE